MTAALLDGADRTLLLLCDHASNHVPAGITLGVPPEVMTRHVAYDIGAGDLTRALSRQLDAPAILGTVSRLVIDLHRPPGHPQLVPVASDGHAVPGNVDADVTERIARFHAPYHRAIARHVRRTPPRLIVAIHSFTPQLMAGGERRPWSAGILYNRDNRAARFAIAHLRQRGIETGDNQPYSGRVLNTTLNRHGEGRGIACLSVEVRQDLVADPAGVREWTATLTETIVAVSNGLAQKAPLAT